EIEQGFALSVYGALRAHGYVPTNKVANLQFAGVAAAALRRDGVMIGAADPELAVLVVAERPVADEAARDVSCVRAIEHERQETARRLALQDDVVAHDVDGHRANL